MRENPLVAFFVERFVFATSIFVGMVLVGLLLGLGLGVELLPRFSVPVIAISTSYPGAGPEEVAEQVSKPLEDALSTLTGVDVIGSSSTEGFSLVFVQFKQGVDVDQGAVEASQKVAAIRSTLPKDASAPVVQKFDPSASPILYLAPEAPGEDLAEVLRYAERTLKPRLQLVSGVADIRLTGAPKTAIKVYLDPDRLQALGIPPLQVVQALSASALNLPLGALTEEERRLVYTLRATPRTASEVAEVLVDPGRGIRVRDVARVEEAREAPTTLNRVNGRPAVVLAVVKTPDANAVAVAQEVRRALEETSLPPGTGRRSPWTPPASSRPRWRTRCGRRSWPPWPSPWWSSSSWGSSTPSSPSSWPSPSPSPGPSSSSAFWASPTTSSASSPSPWRWASWWTTPSWWRKTLTATAAWGLASRRQYSRGRAR